MITPARYGGTNFSYVEFEKAKVVILPVPYEATVTYKKGTKNGPSAIFEASAKMELFDDELNVETHKLGFYTMPPLNVADLSPDNMIEAVYKAEKEILAQGKFPVLIGGEHSVSAGAAKAVKEYAGDMSILHLDAHNDLRDQYEGSRNNHGCAARRMQEIAPVVQLGTRSMSKEEKEFLGGLNNVTKTVSAYDILNDSLWDRKALDSLREKVYISLDLDVLDPSIMPAVGTPEPGGITWYLLLDILKLVAQNREIVGFDVVELAPLDGNIAPDFLAAKLIYRLIGYIFFGKGKKK